VRGVWQAALATSVPPAAKRVDRNQNDWRLLARGGAEANGARQAKYNAGPEAGANPGEELHLY
jgi:hypothetical protein